MKYGGFPGQFHQTSPCYCYQHDIPRRYTPVAVSCSLHFTPLWTLISVLRLDHENEKEIIDWVGKLDLNLDDAQRLRWRLAYCERIKNQGPTSLHNLVAKTTYQTVPSVHLFFVLPSIEFRCGRKESTRPSLRHLHNYSSSPAPARPPFARHSPVSPSAQLLLPQRSQRTHAPHARSTSPRTLSLRWQMSLVLR